MPEIRSLPRGAPLLRLVGRPLRDGSREWNDVAYPEFGLLKSNCKLTHFVGNASQTIDSKTLRFTEKVEFDGWYAMTGKGEPQKDPVLFQIHTSSDGGLDSVFHLPCTL